MSNSRSRSGDANSPKFERWASPRAGPSSPLVGVAREVGGHRQRRAAVERERRRGHPAVADRHELGDPRRRLLLEEGDRVRPVRAPAARPRGRPAGRVPVPPARAAARSSRVGSAIDRAVSRRPRRVGAGRPVGGVSPRAAASSRSWNVSKIRSSPILSVSPYASSWRPDVRVDVGQGERDVLAARAPRGPGGSRRSRSSRRRRSPAQSSTNHDSGGSAVSTSSRISAVKRVALA